MKTFKNINISSDGSLYLSYNAEILSPNKSVTFQKQDEKILTLIKKKLRILLIQNSLLITKRSI